MIKYIAFLSLAFPLVGMNSLSKKSRVDESLSVQLQVDEPVSKQRLIINNILAFPGLVPFLEARSGVTSKVFIKPGEAEEGYLAPFFIGDRIVVPCRNPNTEEGFLRVFSADSGKLQFILPTDGYIESTSVCASRPLVATGANSVQIWSLDQQECIKKFETDPHYVLGSVCFDKEGTCIAAGSGNIQVWDLEKGKSLLETSSKSKGDDHPKTVCFNGSGNLLLVGYFSGNVEVWSGSKKLASWKAHEGEINLVDITKTGNAIITGSGSTIALWDGKNFSHLETLRYIAANYPEFHRNCGLCVGLIDVNTVQVYSVDTGAVLKTLSDRNGLNGFQLSDSGKFLVTWGNSKRFVVWAVETGEALHILPRSDAAFCDSVVLNSDGNRMLALYNYTHSNCIGLLDWGLPEYLKKVTFGQACLLRTVYEVVMLQRLIQLRAEQGKKVTRLDGTSVSVDEIPQFRLDLAVRYAHLKGAYESLAEPLKKIVSPYISSAALALAKC